jgi:hypothetical protein
MYFSPGYTIASFDWQILNRDQLHQVILKVSDQGSALLFSEKSSDAKITSLPFYKDFKLYRLTNHASLPSLSMDYLSDGIYFLYLDGTIDPMRILNEHGNLILNRDNILDYVCFFYQYVPLPDFGEFYLIADANNIEFARFVDPEILEAIRNQTGRIEIKQGSLNDFTIKNIPAYCEGGFVSVALSIDAMGSVSVLRMSPLIVA